MFIYKYQSKYRVYRCILSTTALVIYKILLELDIKKKCVRSIVLHRYCIRISISTIVILRLQIKHNICRNVQLYFLKTAFHINIIIITTVIN